MRTYILAIYAFVLLQAVISGSHAELPAVNPSHLQYEQNGEASSKSSTITTLGSGRTPRQSRCIRCAYPYDDKYSGYGSFKGYTDDYYGRPYGGNRYYDATAMSRVGYDDRSWYYYPDRYDDKWNRYPDRYGSRYDDRYASRSYDRYDVPYVPYDRYSSYNDYRGNGYDNRDYYRGGEAGYYRDNRYQGGYGGYEGRYNDRDVYDKYYYRQPYDYRNYRPWDETYSTVYGPRPRPLGGAYLLDRDSNTPVAVNGENNDNKMEDQSKISAIEGSNDGGNGGGSSGISSSSGSSSGDTNKN